MMPQMPDAGNAIFLNAINVGAEGGTVPSR